MECNICGRSEANHKVLGNNFCEECYLKIQQLRKNDPKAKAFFRNEANYPNAPEYTKKYIRGIIENQKAKKREVNISDSMRELVQISEQALAYESISKNFMETTGYSFEGYHIIDYLGIKSGSSVLGTGFISENLASLSDLFGIESQTFADKIEKAKDTALQMLKEKCIESNANAVIGVSVAVTLNAINLVVVSAQGTAVLVEKD